MSKITSLIKIFVGLFLIALLLNLAKLENTYLTIIKMKLDSLVISIILFFTLFIVTALNLYFISWAIKKISFHKILKYYILSWPAGLFSIGKIGEFSIIYFLKNELGTGKATAVFILSKITTIFVLFLTAIIGVFIFLDIETGLQIIIIAVLFFVVFFLLFITKNGRYILRKLFGKYKNMFTGFGKTVDYIIKYQKKFLIISVIVILIRFIVLSFFIMSLFQGFNVNTEFFNIFFINAIATLAAFIPVSLNGLGVREGSFTLLAVRMGYPISETISVLLVSLALNYITGGIISMFFLKKINLNIKNKSIFNKKKSKI